MQKYLTEIRWGVIFTAVMLLWMWAEQLVGLHGRYIAEHATYTNLFAIPAILVYVLALRQKKSGDYNGSMSWKQGMQAGLIITLVVVLLSPGAQWLTHNVITPDYFANVQAYAVAQGMMSAERAAEYFSLNNYMLQSVIGAAIMGVLTSVIVAFFLRSKE
ncbi:DUF4199 domain-containing protein [Rheinheimera sp. YQF-2]|uniref:DUF4199 domain-containing protein n=1 Tax=Rheinheimera lutimaris TaxID=2740584 RepID=A0A7Y5AN12_9GAMM|nr:DUF4199 domain-containing protein [Rheinheimera lutimaris]NRQ41397.1 DUF4199 domain-containing protein [Rheinheimera lutimaris]